MTLSVLQDSTVKSQTTLVLPAMLTVLPAQRALLQTALDATKIISFSQANALKLV